MYQPPRKPVWFLGRPPARSTSTSPSSKARPARPFYKHGTTFVLRGHCSCTALVLHGYYTGTSWALHWCGMGTTPVLHWFYMGTTRVLCWYWSVLPGRTTSRGPTSAALCCFARKGRGRNPAAVCSPVKSPEPHVPILLYCGRNLFSDGGQRS